MNETTTGAPLTATVGERVGGDPHVGEIREQLEQAAGGREKSAPERRSPRGARSVGTAARPFPWGALAVAAIGWAFATAIGRRVRARARRVGRRVARLAARVRRR